MKIKILLCILFFQMAIYSQKNVDPPKKQIHKEQTPTVIQTKNVDPNYQDQISNLNKQVTELSQTVGDTKQAFYDSKLNLWNFILTGFGLLIVIAGYFGYKSISDKITEMKTDNEKSLTRSEDAVKEIKTDLVQRIGELKADMRDFKLEQNKLFEKFEVESNNRIDQGLALSLQSAIDKIMKESFIDEIKDISEQVSDLTIKFENFSSSTTNGNGLIDLPKKGENKFEDTKSIINKNNNAFDDK